MLDYKQQVKLATKGLAERDNQPMPKSVTTPEAFYEVMATAVLDAIDLPALLERVTRAERELEIIQEALGRADTEARKARHQPMTDGEASEESSIASILSGAGTSRGPEGTQTRVQAPRLESQSTRTLLTNAADCQRCHRRSIVRGKAGRRRVGSRIAVGEPPEEHW